MVIDRICITDFKKARDIDVRPAKINVLVGPNGTGKTSILQALRYALTGNYPPDAITGGAGKAVVELTFPDIGTLTRTLLPGKNEVRLNGKVTTQKSINDLFSSRTGASSDTAELLTSADVLAGLTSGELSSYFLDNNLLSVEVGFELLSSFCNLTEKGRKALKEKFTSEAIQMADIDRVWNDAKAQRRILKQQLNEAEIRSKDTGPKVDESAEEIDKMLRQLLQKQGELQAAKRNYERVYQQRMRILQDIQKKKDQLGEPMEPPVESAIDKYDAELGRLDKELQNLKGLIATIKETGIRLGKILTELETPTCPISSKLTCTTDKSPIRAELTTTINEARTEYKKQRSRIETLERERADVQAQRKNLENEIRRFRDQELLRKQIEYQQQNIPDELQKPSDQEMQQVADQVEELNRKQALIIQHLMAVEYEEARLVLSEELAVCEEIVRELDPRKGVRQKVLEHSLKPLEDYFNAELSRLLSEYRVRLDCGNGFVIKIIDGEHEYDASKSASAGERSRIWFVLMDLINALSSYRILVYDYTDSMDSASLIQLLQMLESDEVQSRYDHIFVAMIDYSEVLQQLEEMKGISVIRLGMEQSKLIAA